MAIIKLNTIRLSLLKLKLPCLRSTSDSRFSIFFFADAPFTIIIPTLTFDTASADKTALQQLIFEHIIPGVQLKALRNGEIYGNMNHNPVEVKILTPNKWQVNDVNVIEFRRLSAKLISFVEIDGYLNDRKNNFAKRNIQEHNRCDLFIYGYLLLIIYLFIFDFI
jgi:hypothetical protein